MKKDVIISIRHPFAEKIYQNDKTVVLRRRRLSLDLGTRVWIYEPLPVGKVTGLFIYRGLYCEKPMILWHILLKYKERVGIDIKDFLKYCDGADKMYAWIIDQPCRCRPFDLRNIGISRAPQSYMFYDAEILENISKS